MSSRRTRKSSRLQDRDYEILEHIFLYHATTREILRSQFFIDSEPNAVTKVTSRLVDGRFLQRYPLPGNSSYFRLGPAGARIVGGSPKCCEPLGPQSIFEHLGILYFCLATSARRRRMSVAEIMKDLPALLQKKIESNRYALDASDGSNRLMFVRIDGGGTSDHVVRKIRADIDKRISNPLCSALISRREFAIACVTYSEAKKQAIERRLAEESLICPVIIEVVPLLSDLLGGFYDS